MALPAYEFLHVVTCGGWRRTMMEPGPHRIQGETRIDAIPTSCEVVLQDSAGANIGVTESSPSGTYEFLGLPAGEYRVLVFDNRIQRRSKVEHIIIP